MNILKRFFKRDEVTFTTPSPKVRITSTPAKPPFPCLTERRRIYAIGDIHGRHDLLTDLLARIEDDDSQRDAMPVTLIFLGDLVDRGPDSASVVEHVLQLMHKSSDVRCLKGNHEELLIAVWSGQESAASVFSRAGGLETLTSYGADPYEVLTATPARLCELARQLVPEEHISFLSSLENSWRCEDYFFVHAGIMPGTPLHNQKARDMRWIRKSFTEYQGEYGVVVIHGHTVVEQVEDKANRIGIDTGAYASGCLTAVGLEADRHWFIQT